MNTIFEQIGDYLRKGKPFVAFEESVQTPAEEHLLKIYVQKDDGLYTSKDYSDSGFVIAPFDVCSEPSILFPTAHTKYDEVAVKIKKESPTATTATPTPDARLKTQHLNLVTAGIAALKKPDIQKIVLSRCFDFPSETSPALIFKRLLNRYSKAFVYLWHHPKVGTWMGATPETLLKIEGTHLNTMALASTQAVEEGKQPLWTQKEFDEQAYVTRYIEECLNPFTHQLKIAPPKNIQAGKLWHLKSEIEGTLKDPDNFGEMLQGFHPTPAVCGFPKEKTKSFILDHEGYNREFYTGFIGELNRNATDATGKATRKTQLYVNLRCMQTCTAGFRIYVGGGIVKGSVPEKEWQETVNKSRTMLDVIV